MIDKDIRNLWREANRPENVRNCSLYWMTTAYVAAEARARKAEWLLAHVEEWRVRLGADPIKISGTIDEEWLAEVRRELEQP
jgi:hypothetical protein